VARLYSNKNFPQEVVEVLRQLGHDVLTTHQAGKSNQSIEDDEVLAYASEISRTILTINRRDFIRLHRQSSNHAGIIVCTQDSDVLGQAARIDEAIRSAGELPGQLIRVNRPQK
jgi:predicted nuclease of predicted toxin-antitoxin system